MEIINLIAQAYAEKFTTEEDSLLEEISRNTASDPQAVMLSGCVQGKFLEIISKIIRPENVLEIGTFVGYSAICLSKGLAPGGKLHTIDINTETAATAQGYFNRSNGADKIILHIGNALEIIPTLDKLWDLVFIDADKPNYTEYYKLVLPRMKSGGVILADNVLFHGEVLEKRVTGNNAKAIQAFNEYVQQDESVDKVLLTIRDGLFLIRKK